MAEVDHVAEFTSAELDLLEDALDDPALVIDAPSKVRGRLESFRELLTLAEGALPAIEVPEGLLDSVLAEARSSPAVDLSPAAANVAASDVGLWQRLRRSLLLPGVALAATAALLVIVLKPDGSDLSDLSEGASSKSMPAAMAAGRDEALAPQSAAVSDAEAGPMVVPAAAPSVEHMEDPALAPEDFDEEVSVAAEELSPKSYDELKRRPAKNKKAAKRASGGASVPADYVEPAKSDANFGDMNVDAEDKDALRGLLQGADSDRRRGRCAAAIKAYSQLMGVKGNEEARALMGLGLCAEAAGDVAGAEGYFRRAKSINPALDPLIEAERAKMTSPQNGKRAKTKSASSFPLD